MDTPKKFERVPVAITTIFDGKVKQVEGHPGGPIMPKIGNKPDKKTQSMTLLEYIASLNRPKEE